MFIYVLTDGIHYKIGVSKNPSQRVRSLQTGNGNKIKLITKYRVSKEKALKLENYIHNKLFWQNRCRHSKEWFSLTKEHLEVLANWIKEFTLNEPYTQEKTKSPSPLAKENSKKRKSTSVDTPCAKAAGIL